MKSKLKSKLVAFIKEAIRAAVAAVAGVAGARASANGVSASQENATCGTAFKFHNFRAPIEI